MKPYYEDDSVKLYHGDCLELADLWTVADVLVTDPPYGMTYRSSFSKGGPTAPIAGDESTFARDAVIDLWGFKAAILFGTWRVPRPDFVRQLVIWDKGETPGMGDLALPWGPSHEDIYIMGEGFTGRRSGSVLRCKTIPAGSADRPDHPTPKPLALMEALIAKCPPGVIADPFVGSGSTLVAAKALGRRAIGVELEERYCEIAARRLAQDILDFGDAS